MRIPYGFKLTSIGTLEINENEAETEIGRAHV